MHAARLVLLAILVSLPLIGCGGNSDSGSGVQSESQSPAAAKKHLLDTAKKMDGPFAAVVQDVVDSVESGDAPWSIADERMQDGDFTPETMAAYQAWRNAMISN
jgi:hypothetical protein